MATNTTQDTQASSASAEPVLTVADAARFLRVSESVVRRLIRERRIPYFRIDGRFLLSRPSLEEWIFTIIFVPLGHPNNQVVGTVC